MPKPEFPFMMYPPIGYGNQPAVMIFDEKAFTQYENQGYRYSRPGAGSRRRRRPSRKYKKSAKRVFRKKSRSTRRR